MKYESRTDTIEINGKYTQVSHLFEVFPQSAAGSLRQAGAAPLRGPRKRHSNSQVPDDVAQFVILLHGLLVAALVFDIHLIIKQIDVGIDDVRVNWKSPASY